MGEKKEKKKRNPRFVSTILPIIISCVVGFALIVLLIIEPCIINPCFRVWLANADVSNIVVSLLPAIVTVISISLQIHDDSVFKVKIRKYQSIRTSMHFDLLHMVLVSVAGFILQMLASILYRPFTGSVLAVVAGIYSLWFAISELPILMKSEHTIVRILKKFWIWNAKNLQFKHEVFDTAIKNYISTRGIKEAFNNFRSKKIGDDALLSMLLTRQNDFLKTYSETIICYKDNPYMGSDCVDLATILPNVYNSISDLCNLNDTFNYSIYDKDGQGVYLLTRICYLANKLSKDISYPEEKSIERFKRILLHYHWRRNDTKTPAFINNFIITMIFWNITESEGCPWFFKAFRDNDYPPFFYEFDKEPLIYLSVMLSCFVYNSIHVSKEVKEKIDSFMDEPTQGLNSDGKSLREKIAESIETGLSGNGTNVFLSGLKNIFEVGLSLRKHAFDIYPGKMKVFTVDDSVEFSIDLLLKYWFEIFLFHEFAFFETEEVYSFLIGLPEEQKEVIKRVIEHRLLIDDHQFNNSMKTPFFDFVFKGRSYKTKEADKSLVRALITFKDNFNEKEYDETHKPIDDEILRAIKSKEDELIKQCISSFETGREIDKKLFNEYVRTIRLEGESDELINHLEMNLEGLRNALDNLISDAVLDQTKHIKMQGHSFTEGEIDRVLDFKPELTSDATVLKYYCNEEQKKKIDALSIDIVGYLPRHSFAKRDAVNFKVEYNSLASMPRKATDAEINKIIDEEYIPINGLYSFSKYKGSKTGSFLVTREELFERISDRIVFVPMVIRVAIDIKKEDVLVFEWK